MFSKRNVAVVLAGAVLAVLCAAPASANPILPPGVPRADVPTEILLDGTGPGHGVSGFIGPAGSASNPGVAYPPSTAGFTPLNEGFAGIIFTSPPGPTGPTLQMYCIDILTPTGVGYGYTLGTWGEAAVTNVGFVSLLLGQYYPNTALPTVGVNGINNVADQAAAVQAAIWYFSDNYVLAPGDPLLPAVTAIVNVVRVQPPAPAPTPPTLQIIPPPTGTTGTVGSFVGPYVVVTNDADGAAVSANAGTTMSSDAVGTTIIPNGTTVANGAQIWLSRTEIGPATLTAQATATVPSGNVYLYNGNITGVTDAQNLILAQTQTLDANATGTAEFELQAETTTTTTTTTIAETTTTTIPAETTTIPAVTTTIPATTSTTTTTLLAAVSPTTVGPAVRPPISPTGTLPATGDDTSRLAAVATVALLAGITLTLRSRRPRRSQ